MAKQTIWEIVMSLPRVSRNYGHHDKVDVTTRRKPKAANLAILKFSDKKLR